MVNDLNNTTLGIVRLGNSVIYRMHSTQHHFAINDVTFTPFIPFVTLYNENSSDQFYLTLEGLEEKILILFASNIQITYLLNYQFFWTRHTIFSDAETHFTKTKKGG